MLAFLDSLCGALIARDADHIRRLLTHPLARALPAGVRDEAIAIAQGRRRGFAAPLEALRLYHQTAQLLGVSADPATRRTPMPDPRSRPIAERRQMELPLGPVGVQG